MMAYLAKYGRIEAVETILSLMKNLPDYGENTRHTAICDCYAGYVEYRNSNYQKAKQYYLHGLELLEPFHPVNADLVSNLKNNLGQTYLALGERQAAFSAIEEAISIRQKYERFPLMIRLCRDFLMLRCLRQMEIGKKHENAYLP